MDNTQNLSLTDRFKILAPFQIRDFTWLWIAMATSMLGDGQRDRKVVRKGHPIDRPHPDPAQCEPDERSDHRQPERLDHQLLHEP